MLAWDVLKEYMEQKYGIEITDEKLREAIDNRVQALQEKQQAEAEQEKVKVEAQTKLIQAENEAAIKVKQAEAAAETKRIAAEAEAEANRKIAESLTPELIEKIKYEQWNGVMPQVSGGATPIIDLTE